MVNWCFGDSFDLYAAPADAVAGYWDSGTTTLFTLVAGRFSGSRAVQSTATAGVWLAKNSGSNDAVHHIVVAFQQTAALSGTTIALYLQLLDGVGNGQCSINFLSSGNITLTSVGPAGTVLDTWTGGVNAQNTWIAYEFEVVINNTTGSWAVRRNGNTSNDHAVGSLNTRGTTANNWANRLAIGQNVSISNQLLDDILWRSDAASVPWVGDVRCYTRMPSSDASVQFTPLSGTTNFSQVSEAHQDGATSYVFDATVGHADFYNIAALAATPASVVAVTTRGFAEKSDAGARSGAVQLKSGGITIASPSTALATSFGWLWRTDQTDPNTGAAWTPLGVNGVQIGPVVTA
ncbi:MAG TPA: hypothetical protein VGI78_10655 [Acetobacteraceae bacterium]|jgi:hypothetical protein